MIEGPNAYGYAKSEMGVHRLVKFLPLRSGRRHPFASVEVPEIDDDIEININPRLRVDTFRASGAADNTLTKQTAPSDNPHSHEYCCILPVRALAA